MVNDQNLSSRVPCWITNETPQRAVVAARKFLVNLRLNGRAIEAQYVSLPPRLQLTSLAASPTIDLTLVGHLGIARLRDLVTTLDPAVQIAPDLTNRRVTVISSQLTAV